MSNVSAPITSRRAILANEEYYAPLIEAIDAASVMDCVECGKALSGDNILAAYLGTFRWGIVNGCGECGECGFPYVYYHRFGEGDDQVLLAAYVPNAEIPLATPPAADLEP